MPDQFDDRLIEVIEDFNEFFENPCTEIIGDFSITRSVGFRPYIERLEVNEVPMKVAEVKTNFKDFSDDFVNNSDLEDNHGLSRRVYNFLERNSESFVYYNLGLFSQGGSVSWSQIYKYFNRRLLAFYPNLEGGDIKLWLNEKSRSKGRAGRQTMKPGRAIRKIYPFLSDIDVEILVDRFKEEFTVPNFEIKVGNNFSRVYTMARHNQVNINCNSFNKSLSDSCMRYKFQSYDYHPADGYDSGDFEIVYALTDAGKIGARSILHKDSMTYAPIYGANSIFIKAVEDYYNSRGCERMTEVSWSGAKIKKLSWEEDEDGIEGYVGPYLDINELGASIGDEYFTLDTKGTWVVANQYGIIYED